MNHDQFPNALARAKLPRDEKLLISYGTMCADAAFKVGKNISADKVATAKLLLQRCQSLVNALGYLKSPTDLDSLKRDISNFLK